MKLNGTSFQNSDTCKGVSFSAGAPLDLAEIEISGRYPESGWARNTVSHEMVYILKGSGTLKRKDDETIRVHGGDVIHVPPGTWFVWNGSMTILMACSPAFSRERYEIEEEA